MHMKSEDSKISHKSTVIDHTSRGHIMVFYSGNPYHTTSSEWLGLD
jgi:uridylate kinase